MVVESGGGGMKNGTGDNGAQPWKFAQCFGDKGEMSDITEGMIEKREGERLMKH